MSWKKSRQSTPAPLPVVVPPDTGTPVTAVPTSPPTSEAPPGETAEELRAKAERIKAELAAAEAETKKPTTVLTGVTEEEQNIKALERAPQQKIAWGKRAELAEALQGIVDMQKHADDPAGTLAKSPWADETEELTKKSAPMFAGRGFVEAEEKLREAEKREYTSERANPGILDEWLFGWGEESPKTKIQVEGEPEERLYAASRKRDDLRRMLGLKGDTAHPERWLTEGWRRPHTAYGEMQVDIGAHLTWLGAQGLSTLHQIGTSALRDRSTEEQLPSYKILPTPRDIFPDNYVDTETGEPVSGWFFGPGWLNLFTDKPHRGGIAKAPYGDKRDWKKYHADPEKVQKAIEDRHKVYLAELVQIQELQKRVGEPTLMGSPRLAEADRRTYAEIAVRKDKVEQLQAVLDQLLRVQRVTIPAQKAERVGESLPLTEEQRDKRDSTQGFVAYPASDPKTGAGEGIDPYGESIRDPIIDDDKRKRIAALKAAYYPQL